MRLPLRDLSGEHPESCNAPWIHRPDPSVVFLVDILLFLPFGGFGLVVFKFGFEPLGFCGGKMGNH